MDQNDTAKWTRTIVSNYFKLPVAAQMVHPSRDFEAPTPAGILSLLPSSNKKTAHKAVASDTPSISTSTVITDLSISTPDDCPARLLPRKATPLTEHTEENPMQSPDPFMNCNIFENFPTDFFASAKVFLHPINPPLVPLFPGNMSSIVLHPFIQPPYSSTFLLDLYTHCSQEHHVVLVSRPVFFKPSKEVFRQVGRMSFQEGQQSTLAIAWLGGRNPEGSLVLPAQTMDYHFQVAKEPDTTTITCVSPLPSYEVLLFVDHPFFLPRWTDGFYQLVDFSSEHFQLYITGEQLALSQNEVGLYILNNTSAKEPAVVQTSKDPHNSRLLKSLKTDTNAPRVQSGTRRGQGGSAPTCDIDGANCQETPTYARFGSKRPSRCFSHRMPQMVKVSQVVHPQPKKADKQPIVQETSTAEADMPPPDIFEPCTQSAPDESAIGQSLGDLFGKQASPTKNYVCKEKNCKKRATFTHEAEDDDSIAILCADHAKNIPGTYVAKGVL